MHLVDRHGGIAVSNAMRMKMGARTTPVRQMFGLRRLSIWLLLRVACCGGMRDLFARMRGIWSICIVGMGRTGIRLSRRWEKWVFPFQFGVWGFLLVFSVKFSNFDGLQLRSLNSRRLRTITNVWFYRDAAMQSTQCYTLIRADALPRRICCGRSGCRVCPSARPGRRDIEYGSAIGCLLTN